MQMSRQTKEVICLLACVCVCARLYDVKQTHYFLAYTSDTSSEHH